MTSLVFLRAVRTANHVLVKVYADGRQTGVLAFTHEQWAEIEQHGGIEIKVATKYREDDHPRRIDGTQESGR